MNTDKTNPSLSILSSELTAGPRRSLEKIEQQPCSISLRPMRDYPALLLSRKRQPYVFFAAAQAQNTHLD